MIAELAVLKVKVKDVTLFHLEKLLRESTTPTISLAVRRPRASVPPWL
jgi:hypothetical protein